MVHVVATIQLAAGKREAFLKEFRALVPSVLAEKGCIEYGPTVDLQTNVPVQPPLREDVVTVIEKWDDIPSLEAHLVAPHMLGYRAKVKDLVRSTQVLVLQPV
ncbi:MAG TPA: putative quinol monooxygenase [Pirellulales bacterium]|jgi:quinol monooxygenase YgiN|nr:putative quinol monooxygenase [Pirellulales bacterium]